MKTYNYTTQKVTSRDDSGRVKSIMPIYEKHEDAIIKFNELVNDLRKMAKKFEGLRFNAEMSAIPENDFNIIKDDLGFQPQFTDHGSKFFYSVNPNAIVIGHKEI